VPGSEPGVKGEIESIYAKDRRISRSLPRLKKKSATTPSRTDFLIRHEYVASSYLAVWINRIVLPRTVILTEIQDELVRATIPCSTTMDVYDRMVNVK
jgi:hypothetical protein